MKKIACFIVMTGICFIWANAANSQSDAEKPAAETRLSSVPKLMLSGFRFEGNTVFSDEELSSVLSAYVNREVTAEELQEAKNTLTRYYYDKGYVNSGAVIPDQNAENGIVLMQIIEGKLTHIEVSGDPWLRKSYIIRRAALGAKPDKPLNVATLQERLQILKQDPRIENINAALGPGIERGEAILRLEIEESEPYHLGVKFNNYNSPGIGSYRGEIYGELLNLTGWGDSLRAQYGITEGLDDYAVTYTVPLTRWDTTLSLHTERSKSVVVSYPFDELDIRSETRTYSVGLRQPMYRTVYEEFAVGLSLDNRESDSYLLGDHYSFSEAAENGESEITVLRFSQEWVDRSVSKVIAARSTFSFGLDMMGATIHDKGPHGKFMTWLGQLQWLQRITLFQKTETQILFRAGLNISTDPLVPMETFSIGGAETVRGYRENTLTTDNGFISTIEWRVNVAHLKIPGISKNPRDGVLQVCPFADFGKGWNTDREDPGNKSLPSIGVGLRWSASKLFQAEIFWGKALRNIEDSPEYDIQDDGIHFQIISEIF